MKKIQSGFIQTLLMLDGRLYEYRCTLPLPAEMMTFNFAEEKPATYECIRGRWYYMYSSKDFDDVMYHANLMQVTINDWKVCKYEELKQIALSKCVTYKTKS